MCLVCSTYGQEAKNDVCTNKVVDKINSRGVKIGLKIDEVLNLFDLTEEAKQSYINEYKKQSQSENESSVGKFGYINFLITPKQNNGKFDGIETYSFGFFDGQLVSFSVNYAKLKWVNLSQFTNTLIRFFDLPKIENWQLDGGSRMKIQCGNYFIYSRTLDGNGTQVSSSFSIGDNRPDSIIRDRRQKFIEEIREKEIKAFKP